MIATDQLEAAIREVIQGLPPERREPTSRLIRNQLNLFQRHAEEAETAVWGHNGGRSWHDTFNIFGKDWIARFLGEVIAQMKRTILFEIARFEIATQVVENVSFARYREENGMIFTQFQTVERKMHVRRCPKLEWGQDMPCDWNGSRARYIREEMWRDWASTTFNQFEREALNIMREAARTHGFVLTSVDEFLKTVERESERLHADSLTGPANMLLVSKVLAVDLPITDKTYDPHLYGVQRIGKLDGRWDVYADPYLPEHEAVLWHYTPEMAHVGLILHLLYFDLPGHMDDGCRMRYSKLLTNDKLFRLLRIQ